MHLQTATQISKPDLEVCLLYGELCLHMKKKDEAKKYYALALTFDKKNKKA